MLRFILPTILIGLAIATFFTFTSPLYKDISELRVQAASYDQALSNSKALENERDKLTKSYNAIDPNDLIKLQKMLPDNVDNIRLILEIEKIATPYGMALKDVKYETADATALKPGAPLQGGAAIAGDLKEYGTWNLQFSTQGTYTNFEAFLRDLESNLRVVDVSSIEFSSDSGAGANLNLNLAESYKYDFTIKTYWLKN